MSVDKKELQRIIFLKANRLKVKVKMETMKKDPKGSMTESKEELKEDSDSDDDEEEDKNSEVEEGAQDGDCDEVVMTEVSNSS